MPERGLSSITVLVEEILAGRKTVTRRPCRGKRPPAWKGDTIWVRETYYPGAAGKWEAPHVVNSANPSVAAYDRAGWKGDAPGPWRPSICMSRWAARLFLEVIDARCEPLQDIAAEDVSREGTTIPPGEDTLAVFAALRNRIYAHKGLG